MSETLSRKPVDAGDINDAITGAHAALGGRQKDDGHWVFELEADATIPSEYVLLEHYLDRIDQEKQDRIGVYLRRTQCDHGGWPLYEGGKFDLSATVKAYFALKAIGDNIDAPHMKQAREAILDRGGAARANVFTRIQLALFGEVPWRATPVMPVELMLLPRTAFFSVWNMAYWSRAVIAPMLVLGSLKPLAVNPRGIHVQELFVRPLKKYATGSAALTALSGDGCSSILIQYCALSYRCCRARCIKKRSRLPLHSSKSA